MIKKTVYIFMLISLGLALNTWAGSVAVNNYHPSPFGKYANIKLFPRTTEPSTPCPIGTLYMDQTENATKFCGDNGGVGAWETLGMGNIWSQSGDNIFLADANPDIFVGVSINAPDQKLHLYSPNTPLYLLIDNQDTNKSAQTKFLRNSDSDSNGIPDISRMGPRYDADIPGSILEAWTEENIPVKLGQGANSEPHMTITPNGFVGINESSPELKLTLNNDGGILLKGTSTALPASAEGPGTRMVWYPNKGAFRAGTVTGTEWDDANIGANSSMAMGYNTIASGSGSIAIGNSNTASGPGAIALGKNNIGTSFSSIVWGMNNTATNAGFGVTMGYNNSVVDSHYGLVMGTNNSKTITSGNPFIISGTNNLVEQPHTVTIGTNNTNSAQGSVIFGGDNTTTALWSTAIGKNVTTQAAGSTVVGQYNIIAGDPGSYLETNPHFVIGNGTSDASRSNAVTVLKNGNTGIGIDAPTHDLHIDGSVKINESVSAPACNENGTLFAHASGALCFCDGTTWRVAGGTGNCL